jgi:hypothetical protein
VKIATFFFPCSAVPMNFSGIGGGGGGGGGGGAT